MLEAWPAEKAAADKAAAERAAFFHNLLNKCGQCIHAPAAQRAEADKAAVAKAAADKAAAAKAAAKAQQEAEDAHLAAALAASLDVSGLVTPPSPPRTLATTRFIESYNKPESRPDQLYALMTTDWHRLPERRAARTVQPHRQQLVAAALPCACDRGAVCLCSLIRMSACS